MNQYHFTNLSLQKPTRLSNYFGLNLAALEPSHFWTRLLPIFKIIAIILVEISKWILSEILIESFFKVILYVFVFVIVKTVIKSKCDEARRGCIVL